MAIIDILGKTHLIKTVTARILYLFLFSNIVLILLPMLEGKRGRKRLKAIDSKLEKYTNMLEAGEPPTQAETMGCL
ncbi:MAG: hypothetical protein QME40_02625 [bacterium]|nr:hypothetical protein [bacterium]